MEIFLVVFATAAMLILLTGGADAAEHWGRDHVLNMYIGAPSTIIAGPGSATNNMSEAGLGTFMVFDVTARAENDDTSKYYGQCRGWFLVDNHAGDNVMNFFTLDFAPDVFNGSIIVSGTQDLTLLRNTMPIIGGSGYFSSVKGYVDVTPVLPGHKGTATEELLAVFYMELHYRVPKLLQKP